jgi:hypothetical protein
MSSGAEYRLDKVAFNCEWALKEGIADEAKREQALRNFRRFWVSGHHDDALEAAGEALGLGKPLAPYIEWKALNAWKDGDGVTVALDYRLGDSTAPDLMPEPNPRQRFFAYLHVAADGDVPGRIKRTFTFLEPFEAAAEDRTDPKLLDFEGDPFLIYYDEGCGFWLSEKGAIRVPIPAPSKPQGEYEPVELSADCLLIETGEQWQETLALILTADEQDQPVLSCKKPVTDLNDPVVQAFGEMRGISLSSIRGFHVPIQFDFPPVLRSTDVELTEIMIVMGWDNPVVIASEGTLFVPDRPHKKWRDLKFSVPDREAETGYLGFATENRVYLIPRTGSARNILYFKAQIPPEDVSAN